MLLLLPYSEYLRRLVEPRNIADIVFVFLLVYGVLKLLRGTRVAPMAAGIGVLVFFYWLSGKQDLTTLEFVRSEEHTSELQSRLHLVCRLLLEKKKQNT